MSEWLHGLFSQIIAFAGAHPSLVGVIVFTFSCSEGLAIIGATLPGESVLLAVIVIAGAAGANPWMMLFWATLGAATGDGISFWLGHAYGEAIARWPGVRSNPELLETGKRFIEKHGSKSIAIARFIPVVRSVVPLAAGVFKMDINRFYVANVTSALAWAIVHVFPAVALGAAYTAIGEVSGRLAVIAVIFLVMIAALVWLVRLIVVWLAPSALRAYTLAIKSLSERPDRLPVALARLLDPNRRGFVGLVFWSAVLIAAIVGSMGVLEDLVTGDPLVRADVAINHLVQGLRSEPIDALMVLLTAMGDALPLMAASSILIGVLLFQRAWRSALAVIGVIVTAGIMVPLIKVILHKPRPIEIYTGAESYSFPSGHVTMTAAIFGIFAVLISRGLAVGGKIAIFSLFVIWVTLVGASRIYLSAHWPSDVIGGMLFGIMLTAVFALLVNQFSVGNHSRSVLVTAVLATFFLVGGYHAASSFNNNLVRYESRISVQDMSLADWTNGKWRSLPANRIDLGGESEEPLSIQWAGQVEIIASAIEQSGWRRAKHFTSRDALIFFSSGANRADIPPLPILHNGRMPSLTLVQSAKQAGQVSSDRFVLRFWRTDVAVTNGQKVAPMFLGSVTHEVLEKSIFWTATMRERKLLSRIPIELIGLLRNDGRFDLKMASASGPLLVWRRP